MTYNVAPLLVHTATVKQSLCPLLCSYVVTQEPRQVSDGRDLSGIHEQLSHVYQKTPDFPGLGVVVDFSFRILVFQILTNGIKLTNKLFFIAVSW